ncbi:MAG: hypothetical protein OXU63_00665 [Acidobacteriota bacterium]|nr:hypothetical protein [Acidobacteriota bacterium]
MKFVPSWWKVPPLRVRIAFFLFCMTGLAAAVFLRMHWQQHLDQLPF